ncbi:uncharacterized protein [Penaeus vannamei]|uniref:uncharacterized protein isoform X2 n=1 Tax=Penaeus vannamei TaxID=6689 RepID=UPI00387F98C1
MIKRAQTSSYDHHQNGGEAKHMTSNFSMRNWIRVAVLTAIIVAVIILFDRGQVIKITTINQVKKSSTLNKYDVWPPFSVKQKHTREWFVVECFSGTHSEDVESVFGHILSLWSESENPECIDTYQKFTELYEVHDRYSKKLDLPGPFAKQVNSWFQGNKALMEDIHHQHLIHVFHPLTSEHTVYNPVRAKRPMPTQQMNLYEWVEKLAEETSKNCDFCKYNEMTAVDEFGRDDKSDTARVTNTFKVEAWHSMVVTKHLHHPLNFTKELMNHFFKAAMSWIYEVSRKDPAYIYPNIAWDTLHHAGASQIHPHIHMMMAPDHYYGYFELMRSAAQRYYQEKGENYFNAVLEVHAALGLVVEYGDAVAIPIMTGKADLEVMFLSDYPGEDFYSLIYHTINAYHDTFTQFCKSFVGAWPALGTTEAASRGRMPTVARLISRGDCTSLRTDFSSYEIFQIVYRTHDPWQIVAAIKKAIKKNGGN